MLRLLVTRASPDGEETARRITALGHEAILAPLRVVVPVFSPAPQRPAVLIATSANALRFGTPLPEDWRGLPFHGVGEQTAQAARASGLGVQHVAPDVMSLIKEMPLNHGALYLAGSPRRDALEVAYAEAEVPLPLWLRYRMEPVNALPEAAVNALKTRACDGVLHFSAESAVAYAVLAEKAGLLEEAFLPPQACLSDEIGIKLRVLAAKKAFEPTIIVSPEKTAEALIHLSCTSLAA